MEGTAGFITRNALAQNVPGGMQSTLYSGGYAVVSVGLGKRNRRKPREKYDILKSILPRGLADELLVDVRDDLRAPQPEQRPPGEYPDFGVAQGVRQTPGFDLALEKCRLKLHQYGIVFVGCNAGRHRSATVAGDLGRQETNAYVVHAGLSNITAEEIAALTLACVNSWPQIESASYFRCVPQTEIFALGWTWRGFTDAPAPLIPAGTQLQVLRVAREHPFPCVDVRLHADPFRGNAVVPLSFLVPFCVHVLQTSGRAPGVDKR